MHIVKRIIVCLLGIFTMGFGIALAIRADLGTPPISCFPYVLSLWLNLSMGTMTFIVNIFFVLLQILILRTRFKLHQLLQIPLLFVFSAAIDTSLRILTYAVTDIYLMQFMMMLASCGCIALGISFLLRANILMMPGDSLVKVIADVSKKEFGKVKVVFDCTLVVIAAVTSLLTLQGIFGIREGSLAAALLVGTISRWFTKLFNHKQNTT